MSAAITEIAAAKLNLGLHVRGKLPDGRHAIETVFAFCTDGDRLSVEPGERISLEIEGEFAGELGDVDDNLILKAARALSDSAQIKEGAAIRLTKNLPVASGIGGGSADAAAALRLLTSLWQVDPRITASVAPALGSDVPACLLSLPMRGEGAGERLSSIDFTAHSGTPVLLVNPRVRLSTAEVYRGWDRLDRGALGHWRDGRNDLEGAARALAPQIGAVIAWLEAQPGVTFTRMSGSGPTCFALFECEEARDSAAEAVPRSWWRLATLLR